MSTPVLELRGVSRTYGALRAVDGIDLQVAVGERRALIGPNGAGKTTLFDLVGGRRPVTSGRILLDGQDVTDLPEHRRARLGIAQTFQHSTLFAGLPAEENVALAVRRHLGVASRPWPNRALDERARGRAADLLAAVGLAERGGVRAGDLSHGEKRQLEVGVALATEPRLLLLDEPVSGMSPAETEAFVALVGTLPAALSLLLIEHDMDVVFAIATRVTVLDAGRLLAEGTPEEIRADPAVREAYLGSRA